MKAAANPLRIAVIAPLRYPIRQPHAGGLEAAVWDRVRMLRARGHRVELCAVEGSDFLDGGPDEFVLPPVVWPDRDRATDTTYPPGYLDRATDALRRALDHIARSGRFDLVDNHSLHGLPLEASATLGVPMLTTLHTPPLPAMLRAHAEGGLSAYSAVSSHTAEEWRTAGLDATVLPNAIDADRWTLGPGGDDLVWFGRVVPEKGAHLAIHAARLAGRRLRIAGRIGDVDYFEQLIAPQLGPDVEFLGPLSLPGLAELVGGAACALVTPMWEEPFGLVIAEAFMTGTPVAAFDTGGVAEVVGSSAAARLVPMGDVDALGAAALALGERGRSRRERRRTRAEAVRRFSLERRVIELEALFAATIADAGSHPSPAPSRPVAARSRSVATAVGA